LLQTAISGYFTYFTYLLKSAYIQLLGEVLLWLCSDDTSYHIWQFT